MSLRNMVLGGMANILLMLAPPGSQAQEQKLGPTIQGQPTVEPKSLKERLSDKASDEQRVDNCKVPVERRGPKKRPGCEQDPTAAAPSQFPQ